MDVHLGRPSKVLRYGLSDRIQQLLDSGYTYQEVADEINANELLNINDTISKDTVSRYVRQETKTLLMKKELEEDTDISKEFQTGIRQLIFNIDSLKLGSKESKALKGWLKRWEYQFRASLTKEFYQSPVNKSSEWDNIRNHLIQTCKHCCKTCQLLISVSVYSKEDIDKFMETYKELKAEKKLSPYHKTIRSYIRTLHNQ